MKYSKFNRTLALMLSLIMIVYMLPFTVFSSGTATFTRITTAGELITGKYVMIAENGFAPTTLVGSWVLSEFISDFDHSINNPAANLVWDITVSGDYIKLTDSNGATIAPKGGNNNGIISGEYSWLATCINGTFRFHGQGQDTVVIASGVNFDNKFRAYKTTTIDKYPRDFIANFTLYRLEDSANVTPDPSYPKEPVMYGTCGDDLTWILDNEGTLKISGTGNMHTYSINNAPWYDVRDDIKVIKIESGVTSIGYRAFVECSNLVDITIPEGVTYIGVEAFYDCTSLTDLIIPGSVISIGNKAFMLCSSLASVKIGKGVESFGNDVFHSCFNLTSVELPDSIHTICDGAFSNCTSLRDVYYSGTESQWNSIRIGWWNSDLVNATIHFESEMPTEPKYNSLWTEEHLRYASSEEYESQIVPGYTGKLDNVFSDIMDDTGIKAYNLLDAVESFLNAEGSADERELYQLILAEILYSRTNKNLLAEMYAQNLQKDTVEFLEILANSEEVVSAFTDPDNYDDLMDALEILQKVDIGSGDYSNAYTSFMNKLKGNVSKSKLKSSISKNAKVTVLGIGLDLLFADMEAMEDIMQYIINCMAYESTSEEFKMVMRALANKAETMSGEAYFPRLRDYDGEIDWEAMSDAINEFVDALDAYEQKGMEAVAEAAVKANQDADVAFTKSAVKKVAVLAFDSIVGCVPVLNICNVGVKAAVSGGKLLVGLLTDVDDCAYALEMMVRIYCFSVLMDSVADDYADQLSKDNETAASLFDESVSVYRSVVYHGSEYGVTYVYAKLDDVYRRYMKELEEGNESRNDLAKIQWYQSDLEQLIYQQEKIENIICHNPYLDYSPEAEPIDYCITDSKLYFVACPVEVTIRSDVYGEIAVLSDSESVIPEGLEHYFRVIETEPGSGEFMKVAIVPEGYEVILQGTGNGTMDAAVIEYHDGVLEEPEFFFDIPVTAQSEGYFDEVSGEAESDELIFDDVVHDGESGGCPLNDVPVDSFYYESVMWAVENGITNGATATTFNPGGTCLRAQVVTFLHRAADNPEPTSTRNPFTDVKSGDFFYKPVLWAVEKGITNGVSATAFGSYANCNRAAVVTFLWRAAGSPEPESTSNPFVDVKTTDFFYKPVLWAVENGITNGVDATHFGPATDCNRAQVVTFLYRAYN